MADLSYDSYKKTGEKKNSKGSKLSYDAYKKSTVPKTSVKDKAYKVGSVVTDFFGGKAVAETFGAEIAKSRATPEAKKYITQPTVKQTVASGIELGANIALLGQGTGAAKVVTKAKKAKTLVKLAAEGAGFFGAQSGLRSVQEGNDVFSKETGKATARGAAIGAVATPALSILGEGAINLLKKNKSAEQLFKEASERAPYKVPEAGKPSEKYTDRFLRTPKERLANYSNKMGYEAYKNADNLPVIDAGKTPKEPSVKYGSNPRVLEPATGEMPKMKAGEPYKVETPNPDYVPPKPGTTKSVLNVGMNKSSGGKLTEAEIRAALPKDVQVVGSKIVKGAEEDTFIPTLSRNLSKKEMEAFANATDQTAVPQYADGKGEMHFKTGAEVPDEWRNFNESYFYDGDGVNLGEKTGANKVKEGVEVLKGKLPEPEKVPAGHLEEYSKAVYDDLKVDPEKAKRIALGEELPTNGVPSDAYYSIIANEAEKAKDFGLLNKLSELDSVASTSGRKLQANKLRTKDGVVDMLREIKQGRMAALEKRTVDAKTEIRTIASKIKDKLKEFQNKLPNKDDISNIIDSLICP